MVLLESTDRVPLTRDCGAPEFTADVLTSTPEWLYRMLSLRDRIVGRLGFATQPGDSRVLDLRPGGTAGPFTFTFVNEARVEASSADRHISHSSTFFVEQTARGFDGCLHVRAASRSQIGGLYLRLIWPGHKLLMGRILREGARDSNLRQP